MQQEISQKSDKEEKNKNIESQAKSNQNQKIHGL